jgi:Domain of unknown function (DUF4333)
VLGSPGSADEEGTTAMTTPRQPYGPDDRERSGWDPHDREPDDDASTWGRAPAGGWGAASSGYRDEYGSEYRDEYGTEYGSPYGTEYGSDARGEYRSEPQSRAPEYERAGRGGAASGYGDDRHREPSHDRYEPSWGQGPPVAPRRADRRRRRRPWIALAAVGAVVVAILVLGFITPGWFVTRVFDASAVQTGVAKILTDNYAVDGVADVHCPEGVQVTPGATFTCDATIDGDPVKVPVRVTDGKGGYEVGRPT